MFNKQKEEDFYNIGVSYKKADAEIRSNFSLSTENQKALLQEAKAIGINGIFILSTCNRTEISGFASRPCLLIELLCKYSNGSVENFRRVSYIHKNKEAIHHLFKIGTGLDSQILGDYEIVGQLRNSFKLAKEQGTTNAYLERLINAVLQASKRVKNETKLSSGTTSVSYAGVRYITENLENYNKKNILVFGLGKMGKHTCLNLAKYTQNKSVTLINRTQEKVDEFVKEYSFVKKGSYQNLTSEVFKNDVLVVSTGADKPTVTEQHISENKEILILDMSMPSNVSQKVKEMKNVRFVGVDELSKVTDKTLEVRKQEVPKAEGIIETHKQEFNEWLNNRKFVPAINALKQSLQTIQQNEINFHKKKFENFDETQAEEITSRMIQKITTQFIKHLKCDKSSANQSLEVMSKVFGGTLETVNEEN